MIDKPYIGQRAKYVGEARGYYPNPRGKMGAIVLDATLGKGTNFGIEYKLGLYGTCFWRPDGDDRLLYCTGLEDLESV